VDIWLVILLIVLVVAFGAVTIVWGVRAHRLKVSAGAEELIGRKAVVKQALAPRGMVLVEGERWTAISETGRVEPDEEVFITKVDGLILYVSKKEQRR
jgi:membrane-bound serine protease (ClpP class)